MKVVEWLVGQRRFVVYILAIFSPINLQALDYNLFEVGQVRPLALGHEGKYLYATNTPDDRVEIIKITGKTPKLVASIAVGLRPVAIAIRNNKEAWVVNHLSDSVSVIDISNPKKPRVIRTLLVGDEPRDIVFAGPKRRQAFITTAHRGQNIPFDPQLSTPGVGRADIWVFDAKKIKKGTGNKPLKIMTVFADTPRALAVDESGTKVYVAPFASGNKTTTIPEFVLDPRNETNDAGELQPHSALIAKFINNTWVTAVGEDVTSLVNFSLPDYDVFTIDASGNTPELLSGPVNTFKGVGTTLFNMVVNPVSGAVYVSNTDANNFTRFEGPGGMSPLNSTVRGNIVQSRITVIHDGQVKPVHLNKHIDYSKCCDKPGNAEARKSLAEPREMVVSRDGRKLYVAAHSSSKIGIFNTAELEANTFIPNEADHIKLSGGGPTGLVLDNRRNRLFVLTRFNNSIAVVDTERRMEIDSINMYSPEPESVIQGRPFLYDALFTSSHGDSSCASCHVLGGTDHLAWDLGNPTASQPGVTGTANGIVDALNAPGTESYAFGLPTCTLEPPDPNVGCVPESFFHLASLKGPMGTQSLRGLDNHGPMHWRGDRTGGTAEEPGYQPEAGMFDEEAAFNAFNGAFVGLIGRDELLSDEQMQKFTDFALQIMYPPNPIRRLDNSLTPKQARGRSLYFGGEDGSRPVDGVRQCNGCHTLDLTGNAQYGVKRPGFFGTDGRLAFSASGQILKVPHLRNAYDKIGMFGTALAAGDLTQPLLGPGFMYKGDQIRGFGFNHNGGVGTIPDFLGAFGFSDLGSAALSLNSIPNSNGFIPFIPPGTYPEDPSLLPPGLGFLSLFNDPKYHDDIGLREKADIESYIFAFDNNFLPVVGQQVTITKKSGAIAHGRLALLLNQAAVIEPRQACDLIAYSYMKGIEVGYLYEPDTGYFRSSIGESGIGIDKLLSQITNIKKALTFTCVPPGAGNRRALDRDRDGVLDGIEKLQGSDPTSPTSL